MTNSCPTGGSPSCAVTGEGVDDTGLEKYITAISPEIVQLELTVPDIRCAACIGRIENALKNHPGTKTARVNVSTKRVTIAWHRNRAKAGDFIEILTRAGYDALPFEPGQDDSAEQRHGRELLFSLALAGFAAGNIMLLSVAVWSGAEGETRDLFHWLSAFIALPVITIAGRPFFRSAFRALKARHLNMDVPVSLAVILAGGMSLFETIRHGEETYFDAAVMLLFFLLVGRYLDHMMRDRARSAVSRLLALTPDDAQLVAKDGTRQRVPVAQLEPGQKVSIATGERVPVDGIVVLGRSELDNAHLTGEPRPELVFPGSKVLAGATNLVAPFQMVVEKPAISSFLSDMVRMMETAEQGKARYRRIADRAAALYAPAVHILAALTFAGWFWWQGDGHIALFHAISVLIITCPCALGLAVPAVQVVASGRLFRDGVMVKDGAALEKLAEIDTVVFDKTGTLTRGYPELVEMSGSGPESRKEDSPEYGQESGPHFTPADLAVAAGLAQESRHPLSRAIVRTAQNRAVRPGKLTALREFAGLGMEGRLDGDIVRLGTRHWVGTDKKAGAPYITANATTSPRPDRGLTASRYQEVWLRNGNSPAVCFYFTDSLRPGAKETVDMFKKQGLDVMILSGDTTDAVAVIAQAVGIENFQGGCSPGQKLARIEELSLAGHKVLMAGDGINDAPALAAGHVSITPAEASDVGRAAASLVFMGESLDVVARAHTVAKAANRLVRQNFGLALAYNLVAVPVAVAGLASPLIAAIAMSSSSILVTANALRLAQMRFTRKTRTVTGISLTGQDAASAGLIPQGDTP